MVSFFDNSTGGWTTGPNSTGGTWEIGARLSFSADVPIQALRFYRHATGSGWAPSRLRFWDLSTHTLLAEVTSVTDNGAVGWQESTITPVTVDSTHTFAVTGWVANGNNFGYKLAANLGVAPVPLLWPTNCRAWANSGTTGEPTNNDNVLAWSFDVRVGDASIPPNPADPVTAGNMADSLAAWLISTNDNTHQTDGLPWLTKTVTDAIKVVTDKLGSSGSGNDLDWIAGLWRLAGDLTDAEIGLLKSLLDRQSQITGASGGGGSAFFGPGGTQVAAGVEEIITTLAAPAVQYPLSWPALSDSAWEAVDSQAFADDLWWEVPAHLYLCHFTDWAPYKTQTVLPGNTWIRRLGWWAPMKGTNLGERRYVEFSDAQLENRGLFMDGIYLSARPGSAGTVTAYLLHAV